MLGTRQIGHLSLDFWQGEWTQFFCDSVWVEQGETVVSSCTPHLWKLSEMNRAGIEELLLTVNESHSESRDLHVGLVLPVSWDSQIVSLLMEVLSHLSNNPKFFSCARRLTLIVGDSQAYRALQDAMEDCFPEEPKGKNKK